MTATFLQRHRLPIYFVLAFAISWGGVLLVTGPAGFRGASQPIEGQLPLLFLAMFAGPSVAGILLTRLVSGTAGIRELRSSLFRWRVGARWYAFAVLVAPLLMLATLLALSLTSPVFRPGIFVSDDKAQLLLSGIVAGLLTGFFEELGWTGFATPVLRERHGVAASGLRLGLAWGAWHFPLFSGADPSGTVPPALFLPVLLWTILPAFRVLMLWVHDRTGSLLVAMLMHASLTAGTLILQPMEIAGVPALTYNLVLATVLWGVVAVVALVNGGRLGSRLSSGSRIQSWS